MPLSRLTLLVGLRILIPSIAAAAPASPLVRFITLAGNEAFSTREVLAWMSLAPAHAFSSASLAMDLRAIREHYRVEGYLDAQASAGRIAYSADSSSVDLSIGIQEGRRTVIGSISVTGSHDIPDDRALGLFDSRPGTPLDEQKLEQDIGTLITQYENTGYPFVQCRIAGMTTIRGPEEDSLDLTLDVSPGTRAKIDEIRVEGNTETSTGVIVRETRLREGELYSPSKINAIRERLNRLNIFASVSEPELYVRGNTTGLLIKVQEGSTNTFDGIVGYIPGQPSGGSGYLTGLATVVMRNLFGTGRKLNFRWQREDRYSQELGVQYVEPWVLGLPLNLGGGILQRQQDTSFVRRDITLNTDVMISDQLSAGVIFASQHVIPSADSAARGVTTSSTTSIGADLQFDSRDDLYSPTGGVRYRTDYQYGRKRSAGPVADAAVQHLGLDLEVFLSTFRRQVLAIGAHGRALEGGNIEAADMYRFGGTATLRGYRENQFLGSRIGWTNTEYRFLLGRRSFFFGFLDTGYYFRPADASTEAPRTEGFRYGYGIGIRLDTSLGNMGVSFALGQGDSFANGKIHFGLINEF